jgi:hypothetical protein
MKLHKLFHTSAWLIMQLWWLVMGQEPYEKKCYLLTHHPSLMMQWYVPVLALASHVLLKL